MIKKKLRTESAPMLTIEGSVGNFCVGSGQAKLKSLNVKYFLSHVSLDFSNSSNNALLDRMAPVRELFDFKNLDFDQIMQRDIDDARVSSELIPYLLDSKSRDLIKLFPPIVVVVLPLEVDGEPKELYPEVKEIFIDDPSDENRYRLLRSGEIGKEVFEFKQPMVGDKPHKHDLVRLSLNEHRTKLVIVDGQHRAMALLALYRNYKGDLNWSNEKRSPFQQYYAEWTPEYIKQFQLGEINLPVMFCTFPDLCENKYKGDFNVIKASRSIFLTLNKTARKVSNSRNTLLDDNDIIAAFLRRTLSIVKNKPYDAQHAFQIFNVELDQFEDRIKIQNPIALTGVNHLHYIIEHIMLNNSDEDINGCKPRRGKFYNRKDLNFYGLIRRLDGINILGSDVAAETSREIYSLDTDQKLYEKFKDKYGNYIVSIYERFLPFKAHNEASLTLQKKLESNQDRKLKPILFDGQGIGRVFDAHRKNLGQRLKDNQFGQDPSNIEAVKKQLDATADRIDKSIIEFKYERAKNFFNYYKPNKYIQGVLPKLVSFVNDSYENVFKTVAFQAALIATFFGELERADIDVDDKLFNDYLSQINNFFTIKDPKSLKKMVSLLCGELEGEIDNWKIKPSSTTFKQIVYRGEMQPDQWPKYKYLILEVWKPEDVTLKSSIEKERKRCRGQIFNSLYHDYRKFYLANNLKHEDDLNQDDKSKIFSSAQTAFVSFLKDSIGVNNNEIPSDDFFSDTLGYNQVNADTEDDDS